MRRLNFFAIGLAVFFAFGGLSLAAATSSTMFKDVSSTYWGANAIQWVVQKGFMTGPANKPGYFDPDGVVTRAQLAVVTQKMYADLSKQISAAAPGANAQNPTATTSIDTSSISPEMIQQLKNARDSQRRSDINTLAGGISAYMIDHSSNNLLKITTTPQEVCNAAASSCTGLLDLKPLINENYLVRIPQDPTFDPTSYRTGYTVSFDSTTKKLTVKAIWADPNQPISVTR